MPFPQIGDYGPYDDWSDTATYAEGDVVYYDGYLYRAMMAISAGDNPRTATYSFAFTDTAGINSTAAPPATPPYDYIEYRTMRKWCLLDLPFSYYQAMLRGLPLSSLSSFSVGKEVRTISAVGFALDGEIAVECSYNGYGISAGLDVTYEVDELEGVDNITLLYSFSAIPLEEVEGNTTYRDPTDNYEAIFWQPNTVGLGSDGPAWGDDCQGMMFASMQTFSRDYTILESYSVGPPVTSVTNDVTTVSFQDNWQAAVTGIPSGIPLNTSPDYTTDT